MLGGGRKTEGGGEEGAVASEDRGWVPACSWSRLPLDSATSTVCNALAGPGAPSPTSAPGGAPSPATRQGGSADIGEIPLVPHRAAGRSAGAERDFAPCSGEVSR